MAAIAHLVAQFVAIAVAQIPVLVALASVQGQYGGGHQFVVGLMGPMGLIRLMGLIVFSKGDEVRQ